MTSPICDFVRAYGGKNAVRLHMPGHKGVPGSGPESLDITEIPGADVLYQAQGIIAESENNAAQLFGARRTIYSAEGSSLCIRAMLYLVLMHAKMTNQKPRIAAGRNAHKVFLSAAALLDLEVVWLQPENRQGTLSCQVSPEALEAVLEKEHPAAVYLTSPDYLGNTEDLSACAAVCRRHDVLLLADHAHGAYLKFLPGAMHALDQGVDICCDSAHKTLPVLTGGAYLHFSDHCPQALVGMGEQAMRMFASTSPSYLIMQSLDRANCILADGYGDKIRDTAAALDILKKDLEQDGWELAGREPLKLTIRTKRRGYSGQETAEILERKGIFCEFADPDYLVMMFTPSNRPEDYGRLKKALLEFPRKQPENSRPPEPGIYEAVIPLREAMLSPFETLPIHSCIGRILASPSVSCPPAVPILICGERITKESAEIFAYYGITHCDVVLEK